MKVCVFGVGAVGGQVAARLAASRQAEVAAAFGWDLRAQVDPDQIASRSGHTGPRISMLQDVLQGRPIEVEVQLGQVQAFAREKDIAVPTIDTLLPLLRGLDRALRRSRAN